MPNDSDPGLDDFDSSLADDLPTDAGDAFAVDPDDPLEHPTGLSPAWDIPVEDTALPTETPSPDAERYELRRALGEGALGRVDAVYDTRLQREVARKTVRRPGKKTARRLRREAWITAQLEHPAIVPLYDAGVDAEGRPWYTMRLLRGRSLDAVLAETPVGPARLPLVRALLPVAQAVAFAHRQGIIHRDLKPANVMLGTFGEVQVVDWGLAGPATVMDRALMAARSSGEATLHATQMGELIGSPGYMSPEQTRGQPASPQSDVWALGVVLFEVLTGTRPFSAENTPALLEAIREGRRVGLPPQAVVPPGLQSIVDQALQVSPADRFAHAGELAEALSAWLDEQAVREATPSAPRRRLWLLGALAAAGWALAAVAAW